MTALELLRGLGPRTAHDIAHALRVPLVDVYVELVAAEARGLAKLRVLAPRRQNRRIEWVAV